MKRSAQVALLFGGLTTAGAGAYALTPSRPECAQPRATAQGAITPGTTAAGLSAPTPGAVAAQAAATPQANPCERPRRSWFSGSSSSSDRSYTRSRGTWSWGGGSSSSSPRAATTSVALGAARTSSSKSTSSRSSFGGFGSTGSSYSRSS
ncbi:MAG: hypothetical protein J0H62_02110 [Rhizobiales bacterium]|nr:hypothetical protein [Hyphomicrobiales bacterium]